MNSEMFQEHVLYFGQERYFCRKIPIFVGTSKTFQNMTVFELRLNLPFPVKKNSLIAFDCLGISKKTTCTVIGGSMGVK